MSGWARPGIAALALALLGAGAAALPRSGREGQDRFNHPAHARLFPLCTTCHLGAAEPGAALFPTIRDCVACHDGATQPRVEFDLRTTPRASTLRFGHEVHAREALRHQPADSTINVRCQACHAAAGASRMDVKFAVAGNCLDCHRVAGEHLAVADTACATCHLALPEARRLTRADVARFPEPPSHEAADFALAGHGKQAAGPGGTGVAASCATCHAREFCITCHVNAPEVAPIQALALDSRSTAIEAGLFEPATHRSPGFLGAHGGPATAPRANCANCHTQESCTNCHAGVAPAPVRRLATAGPGRGPGAATERKAPASHTWLFREGHGPEANARASSCEGCHVRTQCLDCHRPDAAGTPSRQGYHPAGFLTRHPASAYAREATCSDCHHTGQFCQSCHVQSGLTSRSARIGARGFHDAYPAFGLGHGQAARQSLESCASCHAERDCTACHSAVIGGFRFSPHGPGWNPNRTRRKNPGLCVACHGRDVPGGV